MRTARFAAPIAALLLSSTALLAQEAATGEGTGFENVYVEVEGAAIQVSAALAAEACGLDEAGVQSAVQSRLETSGVDPSVMTQGQMTGTEETANADAAAGADVQGTLENAETTAADDAVTTAQGTADPSTTTPGGDMLALAVCQVDLQRAAELGVPTANEIVTD